MLIIKITLKYHNYLSQMSTNKYFKVRNKTNKYSINK
jgi:hypothetical protein